MPFSGVQHPLALNKENLMALRMGAFECTGISVEMVI